MEFSRSGNLKLPVASEPLSGGRRSAFRSAQYADDESISRDASDLEPRQLVEFPGAVSPSRWMVGTHH
jgi:hypothetical protein